MLYFEHIGTPHARATVYEAPHQSPDKHVIVVRIRDDRYARYLADLFNEGKHEEVLFRLAAYR